MASLSELANPPFQHRGKNLGDLYWPRMFPVDQQLADTQLVLFLIVAWATLLTMAFDAVGFYCLAPLFVTIVLTPSFSFGYLAAGDKIQPREDGDFEKGSRLGSGILLCLGVIFSQYLLGSHALFLMLPVLAVVCIGYLGYSIIRHHAWYLTSNIAVAVGVQDEIRDGFRIYSVQNFWKELKPSITAICSCLLFGGGFGVLLKALEHNTLAIAVFGTFLIFPLSYLLYSDRSENKRDGLSHPRTTWAAVYVFLHSPRPVEEWHPSFAATIAERSTESRRIIFVMVISLIITLAMPLVIAYLYPVVQIVESFTYGPSLQMRLLDMMDEHTEFAMHFLRITICWPLSVVAIYLGLNLLMHCLFGQTITAFEKRIGK